MRILLTGGSGSLGTAILALPRPADTTIRVLSRRQPPRAFDGEWCQGDLLVGDDIARAVSGADVIIHAASDPRRSDVVDVPGTEKLVSTARRAGVRHLLYVSIVGVDAIPYRYYQDKFAIEEMVRRSGVPFSVLRITQFHPFIDMLFRRAAARVPLVLPLPTRFRVQSVDLGEAAARVLAAALDPPGGRLRDLGGPEVLTVGEAARAWKMARQIRKPILPLPLPGAAARAFTRGLHTTSDGDRGAIRWQDWLAGRSSGAAPSERRKPLVR
ncbi:MAG: SDR family oxidoreductase [Vicinamibacterales bacterium]